MKADCLAKAFFSFGVCLVPMLAMSACNSNNQQDPGVAALGQEAEKLRQENQDLAQVRTENEEVQKLQKENQDLPKLRSQYQEAARLKKDNEQLRQQVAKLSAAAGQTNTAAALPATDLTNQVEKVKPPGDELTLNEGDDILIEPRFLKQLLPDIDWSKMDRKEPLGVRALIEKDGLQLTNAAQLHEYGITNFIIKRAVVLPQPQQGQETPESK
jgi:hypothetical protein